MKTLLFVLVVLAATAGFGSRAQAQNYPWCAYYGGSEEGENCGFSTWDQCMATIRGMGGSCDRNTQYIPPTAVAPPASPYTRRGPHRSANPQ